MLLTFLTYAPEVINGNGKQTIMSDMYAVGVLLKKMCDHGCFGSLISTERGLRHIELIDQCKSADINQQISAIQCVDTIKTIIEMRHYNILLYILYNNVIHINFIYNEHFKGIGHAIKT